MAHVNDLLDVSKLEAGRMTVAYGVTDLTRLVRLVAGHFETLAHDRSIAYIVESDEAIRGEVDSEKVQRIQLNLLSNAFKFTPPGGRVRCTLRRDEARAVVCLEVADSGPGIPPEHREVVFERLRQLEGGATRRFGGTGLGLAIAREFATLHGGTIAAADAPEGGALLRVELPLRAPEGASVAILGPEPLGVIEAAPRATEPVEALGLPDAHEAGEEARPLVLVVEDNPEMNRFIRESLAPGYRTEGAFDGREGLAKALALRPDLVITDVMMPEMSGDTLVRELRARSELGAVPVLLLTAKADDELRIRLLREGAQDYVTKPFSVEELRARVENLVEVKLAGERNRRLNRELAEHNERLREVTGQLQAANTALEAAQDALVRKERLAVLGQLAGGVSHELRNPLGVIKNAVYYLRMVLPESEPVAKHLRIIEREILTTNRIVTGLLDFARLASPSRTPTDLNELITDCLERTMLPERVTRVCDLSPRFRPWRSTESRSDSCCETSS